MMPMMFGEARRLYGVYHPAAGPAGPGRGVVLCNPYGQEAYRANRAYRVLADALAGERMHVLRFDYSGTGDSSGDELHATLDRWLEDVAAAVEELRAIARLHAVHLLGLRFGAAMALLAAKSRSDVAGLVLWEPVVDGSTYLRELLASGAMPRSDETAGEADGFCLPAALANGIAKVDLAALAEQSADRLPAKRLLITSAEGRHHRELRERLDRTEHKLRVEHIDEPPAWAEENNFGAGPVPARTIKAVTQWYS